MGRNGQEGQAWHRTRLAPAERRKPLEFLRYELQPRKVGRKKARVGR